MKKGLVIIIALFVGGLTAIQAQPNVNTEELLREFVGVWEGSYVAGQGETGLTLTVYVEGGNYKAIFDFYNLPGRSNAVNGKYYMNISYDTLTRIYSLKGYEWILRPNNYGFVDLEGTITRNVFSGSLIGSNYNFKVIRIDEAEIDRRKALLKLNITTVLGPSLTEEVMRRLAEISTNITSEGTDARNDVAWRRRWVERLTNTEELFNKIFSNCGIPYSIFYSTGIKQGKINYQTETIELSTSINLRMNNEWINILDIALQTVKKMDDELQGTGRRSDWGLNDWPNVGVSQTNPFKNSYSGGGMGGTTRYGTQWKTNFSIVFELLNNKNQVIGRQTFTLSPFFEIYCYNRNYYGQFIEYGKSGGTIVDSERAIRLNYDLNNIKTLTFSNVKVNETSDIMTIRITSVNGNRPENARIKIIPLSDSQWNEFDWKEKQDPVIYFR